MGHRTFGYRIEEGIAVIDEREAAQVRLVYAEYLSGKGYEDAAKAAGLTLVHSTVKRMLRNLHYLGDAFYPAIIDRETFDAAEAERLLRVDLMGRNYERNETSKARPVATRFSMGAATRKLKDPYEQASYIYSLIESEERYGNSNNDSRDKASRQQDTIA